MMKNKKVVLLLLLLVLVLALGIGYAMNNKTLNITGTAAATADDNNFKVIFDKDTAITKSENVTATYTDDTNATITVTGLTKKGDTATATYTVKNDSNDIDANVTAATTVTNSDFFKVTTTGITDTATKIVSGNTTTITVTVELIKTPVENQSTDVTVTLTAVPVQQ